MLHKKRPVGCLHRFLQYPVVHSVAVHKEDLTVPVIPCHIGSCDISCKGHTVIRCRDRKQCIAYLPAVDSVDIVLHGSVAGGHQLVVIIHHVFEGDVRPFYRYPLDELGDISCFRGGTFKEFTSGRHVQEKVPGDHRGAVSAADLL